MDLPAPEGAERLPEASTADDAENELTHDPHLHRGTQILTRPLAGGPRPAGAGREKGESPPQASGGLSRKDAAATYSPTRLPVQYHRLWWA